MPNDVSALRAELLDLRLRDWDKLDRHEQLRVSYRLSAIGLVLALSERNALPVPRPSETV